MKKSVTFFSIILLFFVASCKQEKKTGVEKEIISYQKQVNKLNLKISKLQEKFNSQQLKQKKTSGLKVMVTTRTITPELFKHFFTASGNIQSVNEAILSSQVSGQVEKVIVHEGDKVSKGQLLAQLETDIIKNNINEVKATLNLAKFTYNKQKNLWEKHIGSELQYLQAKTNYESLKSKLKNLQTQYDKSFIYAPFSGYIDNISIKEGEIAMPGRPLFHLVNLQKVYVNAEISESYIPIIHKGELVEITIPTYPNIKRIEKVYRIGEVINPQSRTFELQFKIDNPDELLKPNMIAMLTINDYTNKHALVVPSYIIRKDMKGNYLYLVIQNKEGIKLAKKRYVTTGLSSGKYTEIINGIKPGDVVVEKGFNNVSNGSILIIKK